MKNIRNILIVCVCLLAPLCAAANPTVNIKFADDSCLTFEDAGSKQIDVRIVSGQAIANLSLELELRRYDENAKLGAEPVAKAESTQDVQGGGGLAPISVDIEVPAAGFYRCLSRRRTATATSAAKRRCFSPYSRKDKKQLKKRGAETSRAFFHNPTASGTARLAPWLSF